jgi:hypothetical protein
MNLNKSREKNNFLDLHVETWRYFMSFWDNIKRQGFFFMISISSWELRESEKFQDFFDLLNYMEFAEIVLKYPQPPPEKKLKTEFL